MLIKITCGTQEVTSTVEAYSEQGFVLEKKTSLGLEADLWFTCPDSYSGYQAISDYGAQGFLEFRDGTLSPLYVRRSHNFDD